jgi:hypothetical protein
MDGGTCVERTVFTINFGAAKAKRQGLTFHVR